MIQMELQKFKFKLDVSDLSDSDTKLSGIDFRLIQPKLNNIYEMDVLYGTTDNEGKIEFDASIMGDFEMKGIEEGFVFHLGNRDLEVLDTPGHTKDGICLLDRKYRLLFSGDTVVSTPVLMFDTFSDTMSTYLESLKKLAQLRNSYELIFPGHYLRPIGSIYIDDQIACIQEILEKHLLGEKEECGMTKSEVYFYQKALASVLYTEDRIC